MRLYGLLGGNYVVVCKACGKLGGSGDMLPQGNYLVESGTVFTHT